MKARECNSWILFAVYDDGRQAELLSLRSTYEKKLVMFREVMD